MAKTLADFAPPHRGARPISRTPSKFLRQVVDDVRAVMKINGVAFEMMTWGQILRGQCTVCLAGAVVLSRAHPNMLAGGCVVPSDQSPDLCDAMYAANDYRLGSYETFLDYLFGDGGGRFPISSKKLKSVVSYLGGHAMRLSGEASREEMLAFCDNALEMADYLESKGI